MYCVVIFAIFASYTELVISSKCEPPWFEAGSKCLWKSTVLATRAENVRKCREFGATLVSPRSHKENELVKTFIGTNPDENYWLSGQQYVPGEPNYMWMDGQAINYSDWYPGQPNDVSGNYVSGVCMTLNGIYGWNDYVCSSKYMQLCEKSIETKVKANGNKANMCNEYEEKMKALKTEIQDQIIEMNTLQTFISSQSNKIVILKE